MKQNQSFTLSNDLVKKLEEIKNKKGVPKSATITKALEKFFKSVKA